MVTALKQRFGAKYQEVLNEFRVTYEDSKKRELLMQGSYAVHRHEFSKVKDRQGWQYFAGHDHAHSYWRWGAAYWENDKKVVIPPETEFESDHQTDLAMKWIKQQQDKPWFMMLSLGPPHSPYHDMPEKYKDMFDPASFKLRPNVKFIERGGRMI